LRKFSNRCDKFVNRAVERTRVVRDGHPARNARGHFRQRGDRAFRLFKLNSPLPEARRSLNPVVAVISPLALLGRSLVVRKFRGTSFANFKSISQIKTGRSVERGG
jgi:hypothetical protein